MDNVAVRVENIGKRYRIGEREPYRTLRDAIAKAATASFRGRRSAETNGLPSQSNSHDERYIWALRNVSLEIADGEAVGVIGPNGAGKTTILKILSRITEPTEGSAEIHGRIGSLLEVGTGFHQELTGRENVFLNGAILGMRKREIEEKFDEIVRFAELEKFLDTPVKRYSDGMRVRLGFAVAAHLEPEILLIDEVLAVGDVSFQRKCLGKMGEVAGEGRTVVLVSHDLAAIQNLCSRAYALKDGCMFASGEVGDVISRYLENVSRPQTVSIADRRDRGGDGKLRVVGFSISGATNSPDTIQCGASASFEIAYEGSATLRNVDIDMMFYNQFGTCVLFTASSLVGRVFETVPARGTFLCRFAKFPLLPGAYQLRINCGVNGVCADDIKNAATIHVVGGDYYGSGRLPPKGYGAVAASHDWAIEEAQDTPSVRTRR